MTTVFVGGSRHVSRLPEEVKTRLDNIVKSGHQVIVGDADGVDKIVQKYFANCRYSNVVVFCSGDKARNNVNSWPLRHVYPQKNVKGFQFYAAKDREMASEADFGFMIWDGKSPGTLLNVLRLTRLNKVSVVYRVPDDSVVNIKSSELFRAFFSSCHEEIQVGVKERATAEEWAMIKGEEQGMLLPSPETAPGPLAREEEVVLLNKALASGDCARIMEALGAIARSRGMSQVARETGLARESLYRSLDANGNPEFATVLKVLSSMGLQFEAKALQPVR